MAELLDHRELSAALVRHADYWIRMGRTERDVMLFLVHAFRTTRDPRFLEAVKKALNQCTPVSFAETGGNGILETPRHLIVTDLTRRNKMMCHVLGDPMQFLPYGLAVVAAATDSSPT
jgi:hypothetical protein